ncbi:protein translocase subunit SecD [Clostridium pasteurianum]|uniref:Protein translocase subunit SecD n=1 Tax=Clostridium pasteurianum BC1 TaxID=86416 RepID=R4K268_CLOPA|nr:protein translocase subunit SecD [Clostridium pasteurianum]AGK97192.1 protein-export membrane protein, SecD/SecF family [Clostridium pasteurianum BC1]
MKKKSTVYFVLSIVVIAVLAYLGAFGYVGSTYEIKPFSKTINRGLDLQGGVSVVEQITDKNVSNATMQRTIQLLSLRVNKMGVSETNVAKEGADKIRIDVPGKITPDEVLNTIGKTGQLKFVGPDNSTILTGSDVKSASVGTDPQTNKPLINLQLSDSGTKKFADATQKYLGQAISIYMDDQQITSPTVDTVISDGKAQISGNYTIDTAKQQADIISAGALPVTLKAVQVQTVSATLGSTALPMSVRAGLVGIAIVLSLMFIWFRRPGIMADIALILYVFLVLLVFSGVGATLTLSGIAGFLLTVGMAVDANVLIFARIKEELRTGKSIKSSTKAGFQNAMSSIVDSNINTIIAGLVLYFVGSGPVKGFALTLIIGVLVSLFTALFVTKHLLNWSIDIGLISKPKHFGVKRG